jgi:hypothetical protein
MYYAPHADHDPDIRETRDPVVEVIELLHDFQDNVNPSREPYLSPILQGRHASVRTNDAGDAKASSSEETEDASTLLNDGMSSSKRGWPGCSRDRWQG